jgi:hypothetical protein
VFSGGAGIPAMIFRESRGKPIAPSTIEVRFSTCDLAPTTVNLYFSFVQVLVAFVRGTQENARAVQPKLYRIFVMID